MDRQQKYGPRWMGWIVLGLTLLLNQAGLRFTPKCRVSLSPKRQVFQASVQAPRGDAYGLDRIPGYRHPNATRKPLIPGKNNYAVTPGLGVTPLASSLPQPRQGIIPFLLFVLPFSEIQVEKKQTFKYFIMLILVSGMAFLPNLVHLVLSWCGL